MHFVNQSLSNTANQTVCSLFSERETQGDLGSEASTFCVFIHLLIKEIHFKKKKVTPHFTVTSPGLQ